MVEKKDILNQLPSDNVAEIVNQLESDDALQIVSNLDEEKKITGKKDNYDYPNKMFASLNAIHTHP